MHGDLHPGLESVMAFEEARIGIPIERRRCPLSVLSATSSFRPIVELNIHMGGPEERFPVLFDDELMELEAGIFVTSDRELVGFKNRDGSLCPLAGVTENRVNIYFDLDRTFRDPDAVHRRPANGTPLTGQPGNHLAELVLSQALPVAIHNIRNHDWSKEREAYTRYRLTARERVVDEWRRAVRENDQTIEDRSWQIRTLSEKNQELRGRIRLHDLLTKKRMTRQAHEDHTQLVRMLGRGLRSIQITSGLLKVLTAPVEIHWDGDRYEMGCYWIDLPLGEGRLNIRNEDSDRAVDDYPHPHVGTDGYPCLGNIGGTVAQLLGEGENAQLVTLLLEFLRSYNPDNPYLRLERWDPNWEDEDDRWETCYDNASLSDCATCDDWDCPHREDAQRRCYENTDTSDCIACAGCDLHREAIESCRNDHAPNECVTCEVDCPYSDDEEECFQTHDGECCPDCDNTNCTHFCEENDDDEDPS